ncbi:MAG: glutathione S-transferase family protein [Parvularculaceae bacterium]|nr:glutathione S-transferase family protein [Parvularculaceae bacterium]
MLTLVIGDKNLSSWSLRPWLLMKQAGIPFTEHLVRLDRPETKAEIAKVSPSGRVPCLIDGAQAIWDSLAIAETLAEKFPDKHLWPEDPAARARARSVSAEMHSGFQALRSLWPMNFSRAGMRHLTYGIDGDIARIAEIWETCRRDFGREGPFLFGRFGIADAMYAPVVSRFETYGPVALPPLADEWRKLMWALPAMREWGEGAKAE